MKNKIRKCVQQGDVLLRPVTSEIPLNSIIISKKRCVLAHGESGHSHAVDDEDAELIRDGERILLKLERAAAVIHEEHKPIKLEAGIWEIGRVQEYDYLNQMVRPVQD